MQKHIDIPDFAEITPSAPISAGLHGGRAKCLQRLIRLDMPVPRTVALSFPAVRGLASGQVPDMKELLAAFGPKPLVSVRPSSQDPEWGGPGAILNIGMNDARHAELIQTMGHEAADALYRRFIQSYAAHVARLDPDVFDEAESDSDLIALLDAYEDEADEPFPQEIERQLADVLQSMARAWEGTSARLLRQARGAPPDARQAGRSAPPTAAAGGGPGPFSEFSSENRAFPRRGSPFKRRCSKTPSIASRHYRRGATAAAWRMTALHAHRARRRQRRTTWR